VSTDGPADVLVAKGNAWLRHGYWIQAMACFDQALALAAGHAEATAGIRRAHDVMDDELHRANADHLGVDQPRDLDYRRRVAELHVRDGRLDDGVREFESLAAVLLDVGEMVAFLQTAHRLLELRPAHRIARAAAAEHLRLDYPERALATLKASFRATPDDPAVLELVATAFERQGKPQAVDLWRRLAAIHERRGNDDKRAAALRHVQRLATD
jgi:tetratricopeptide (TPR) repeat protein